MAENTIEFCKITKRFGEVMADDRVNFPLKRGEILALLGENGSGKMTLMNMLFGIYFPDGGQIKINGEIMSIRFPKGAFQLDIGMIHQYFRLISVSNAAEGIILGEQGGKYDLRAAEQKLSELTDRHGLRLSPEQRVCEFSISEKQIVEIMKILYRGAGILILDEPTAMPTPQETKRLFAILRKMRKDGKSILIITRKPTEVLTLSDHVTVLRKGQYIGVVETAKAGMTLLIETIVGEKMKLGIDRAAPLDGPRRLRLGNVTCMNAGGVPVLSSLSLTLRDGKILGIAGIAGNGQRELLETVADLVPYSGEICYGEDDGNEKNLKGTIPAAIGMLGVRLAFVSEDRLGMSLVGSMDLTDSVTLRSCRSGASFVTDREEPKEQVEWVVEELSVATPGAATPIERLSGGNVQRVLVGHEILGSPKVMTAAYPARGPDIHSSYMIYQLLDKRKKRGSAVICVGEDPDVLFELCGHIFVLQGGKGAGILDARATNKEELGRRVMDGEESEI